MSLARDIIDRIFYPNRDVHAIPVLDGSLSPNERLDRARVLGDLLESPDALALADDGTLYVSSGPTILACSGSDFAQRRILATFDVNVGALGWSAATGLVAGLAGRGIASVTVDGKIGAQLDAAAGEALRCPTAIAISDEGAIYVTDGSRHNPTDEWHRDLLEKRPASGRLIACDRNLTNPRVLADGLDWPAGVAVSHDDRRLLVTESWAHRLSAFPIDGGPAQVLVKNFTGYPCRISSGAKGDFWLAFFGLRTQLMEFVLSEHAFRKRMLDTVSPDLWMGPRLGGSIDYREAMQLAASRSLVFRSRGRPHAPMA